MMVIKRLILDMKKNLIFLILFLSAVIYALSKLFLQPLRNAIAKLDQLIRDTTYELNTPLSVITMSIEQLDKIDTLKGVY